jgi:hypothetical protein
MVVPGVWSSAVRVRGDLAELGPLTAGPEGWMWLMLMKSKPAASAIALLTVEFAAGLKASCVWRT